MVERRQHLRLAAEPRQPVGVAREGVGQDLERDVTIELGVAGAVDLAHSAGADGTEDFVRTKTSSAGERHARGVYVRTVRC